jgi:hypothetical protein
MVGNNNSDDISTRTQAASYQLSLADRRKTEIGTIIDELIKHAKTQPPPRTTMNQVEKATQTDKPRIEADVMDLSAVHKKIDFIINILTKEQPSMDPNR